MLEFTNGSSQPAVTNDSTAINSKQPHGRATFHTSLLLANKDIFAYCSAMDIRKLLNTMGIVVLLGADVACAEEPSPPSLEGRSLVSLLYSEDKYLAVSVSYPYPSCKRIKFRVLKDGSIQLIAPPPARKEDFCVAIRSALLKIPLTKQAVVSGRMIIHMPKGWERPFGPERVLILRDDLFDPFYKLRHSHSLKDLLGGSES